MDTASSIGEDQLIQILTRQCVQQSDVLVGPGDDCAVLAPLQPHLYPLLKTDTVIEGVHYLPDADPYWVGWKAVARVVSDFAAMGGKPDALVVALAMKRSTPVAYLKQLYNGMQKCAETFAFSIVGGETSSSPTNIITVSGAGSTSHFITRNGASPGDHLYVTGTLGGSISGKHLSFTPRVKEAQWLVNQTEISAMMDLSDGIAKDLPRLADLSEVGYQIELKSIPSQTGAPLENALGDGEDYELLFTTKKQLTTEQHAQWARQFPNTPLTAIGRIVESERTPLSGGWEHFTDESPP